MSKISKFIEEESARQQSTLMMIPSENYTYPEVGKAVGSVLMHKYAEGQPGRRYYNGNVVIDKIETYCEELALKAFKLDEKKWFANVQAYSGTPANLAVYNALLNPGDKILSMFLPDGGHLSHGWEMPGKKISFVSKIFKIQFYKVNPKTQVFDYCKIEKQAQKFKPRLIISGGTAYPREIDHKKMAAIAKKVGAFYLADVAHEAGLIVGGANNSPFPYADMVTMTTHKTLRGPRGAIIIGRKKFEDIIDYSIFPGLQGGPHIHTIAGIAIALEKTQTEGFKKYATQTVINARRLADNLKVGGLNVVSGKTDKHLVLIDLRDQGTNGWIVSNALEMVGIIINRNTVPQEDASPFYPSGIRLGTPAITVRGMKEKEIDRISGWIFEVIELVKSIKIPTEKDKRSKFLSNFKSSIAKDPDIRRIKRDVKNLCSEFPMPKG